MQPVVKELVPAPDVWRALCALADHPGVVLFESALQRESLGRYSFLTAEPYESFVLERGAVAVDACVVHPVLSGRAIERIQASPIRQLVVTDTIPLPASKRIEKIHVTSVARLFADAIQAIHDGSSVSSLFR